jgi:hypothetical protein
LLTPSTPMAVPELPATMLTTINRHRIKPPVQVTPTTTSTATAVHRQPRKPMPPRPKTSRENRENVRKALASLGLTATDSVLAANGIGNAIGTALGNLGGTATASLGGVGHDVRGMGGGGDAVGIGALMGSRSCCGGADGDITLNAGTKSAPTVASDPKQVRYIGSLSREEIQRVMKRAHAQVRYCYEKELAATPDLEGTVSTQFIINAAGSVQSLQLDGLPGPGGSAVRGCMQRVLQRLQFPIPVGGGIVDVRYPFAFTNGG